MQDSKIYLSHYWLQTKTSDQQDPSQVDERQILTF